MTNEKFSYRANYIAKILNFCSYSPSYKNPPLHLRWAHGLLSLNIRFMWKRLPKKILVGVGHGTKTKLVSITGGNSYISDCFFIFVYVSNRIMCDIHNIFEVFFTSASVNFVLYNMLIFTHQQHALVDGAVLCIFLQMFFLKHVTFLSVFFWSSSFSLWLHPPLLFFYQIYLFWFLYCYLDVLYIGLWFSNAFQLAL